MSNNILTDGFYWIITTHRGLVVDQYFAETNEWLMTKNEYIEKILSPCDYYAQRKMIEELEETTAKAAEIAEAASDDNKDLRQLLKECQKELKSIQNKAAYPDTNFGLNADFDVLFSQCTDILTKIDEVIK